ncbi:MAG TPA: hypothetical protein VME23_16935 [Terracidiphilus sp.]|nr:hypothetical protein [Terracidiphilus sp.]
MPRAFPEEPAAASLTRQDIRHYRDWNPLIPDAARQLDLPPR